MAFNVSTDQYSQRIFLDANDRPQYICETYPDKQRNTGSAVWRIYRITYDVASGQPLTKLWAGGSCEFNKICDDRATYTY